MRLAFVAGLLLALTACSSVAPSRRNALETEMFGPASVSFHAFTQVKDWNGSGLPDGVEALMEFQDQFGDPTKAAGSFIFELYEFRRGDPDPRGKRLAYWTASIVSLDEQRQRWNRISRTYSFQLASPPDYRIGTKESYILSAIFQSSSGGRSFAQVALAAEPEEEKSTTRPATQPATAP